MLTPGSGYLEVHQDVLDDLLLTAREAGVNPGQLGSHIRRRALADSRSGRAAHALGVQCPDLEAARQIIDTCPQIDR